MRTFRGPQRDVHLFRFREQILGSESRVSRPGRLSPRPVLSPPQRLTLKYQPWGWPGL